MKKLFKNGEVVYANGVFEKDLLIVDGKIEAVVSPGTLNENLADEVFDCEGKMILPGAIDVHVHFREPGHSYKEDWTTASAAAVAGGVTTVIDMPNNNPSIVSRETLSEKRSLISGRSYVNYGLYMGYNGENIDEINAADGIAGVKVYCAHSTGKMGVDEDHIELAFQKINPHIKLLFHAEDEGCIEKRREIVMAELNERSQDVYVNLHSEIRAPECAAMMVEKLCELAKKYRRPVHICHVSTEREMEIIEQHKEYGVTCEVCPHHLVLSTDDYDHLQTYGKMNPPLREQYDVFALWKFLKSGVVDIVATDHAPHTRGEKTTTPLDAPSGVPGVEMMLPILLNAVNDDALTLPEVVGLVCERPALLFGIRGKGKVEVGFDADLVIVDMDLEKKFEDKDVLSKCGWSPYSGGFYKGWPIKTFVAGKLVCEDRKVVSDFGGKEVQFG